MKHAFSLVELSIVLVILGLLTGGILTGQNLIRAAELRSVTTEYSAHQTAVNTFKDKYFAIPGDMNNATNFWDSAGGAGTLGDGCEAATGTGTQTCNGNGDGVMATPGSAGEYNEIFTFWQHLANAGLVEGSYDGQSGAADAIDAILQQNSPQSKLSSAGWSVFNLSNFAGNAFTFAFDYQNQLRFGSKNATGLFNGAILTPEEAWNIDTKMDDGTPGQGRIIAHFWDTCTDAASNGSVTQSDRTNANYLLSDSSVQCAFHFPKAF